MADIVARIRKCLALSKSANVHEAELAWETAARLLAAHRLTLADLGPAPLVTRDLLQPASQWEPTLFTAAAHAAGAVVVHIDRVWRLYAAHEDALDAAQALYEQLRRLLPQMAKTAWREHVVSLTDPQLGVYPSLLEPGADVEWMESWLFGAANALAVRVDRAWVAEAANNAVTLARIAQPVDAIRTRVLAEVPGIKVSGRAGTGPAVAINVGGFTAGRDAAPQIVLQPSRGSIS